MYEKVSRNDLVQFFHHTVILYKGKPVKVKNISEDCVFKFLDLETQKTFTDNEPFAHIANPMLRIGMVNIDGTVLYVERAPYRNMNIGITSNTLKIREIGAPYVEDKYLTHDKIKRLECPEIADAMMNRYPTLKECIAHNKEFGGAMAFDKQFAIDCDRRIYYKTSVVGSLPKACSTIDRIVFEPQYQHLPILLGDIHGKDSRTFSTLLAQEG